MAKSTFRRLWPALLCTLLGVPCVSGAVNKPAAPKPVTVTELVPTKKFVASWVAPVKDAKGQALDPATLTYSVVLRDYINRTVDTLVSNCRDTVLTWDYAGRTGHFAVQVYARNEDRCRETPTCPRTERGSSSRSTWRTARRGSRPRWPPTRSGGPGGRDGPGRKRRTDPRRKE